METKNKTLSEICEELKPGSYRRNYPAWALPVKCIRCNQPLPDSSVGNYCDSCESAKEQTDANTEN